MKAGRIPVESSESERDEDGGGRFSYREAALPENANNARFRYYQEGLSTHRAKCPPMPDAAEKLASADLTDLAVAPAFAPRDQGRNA